MQLDATKLASLTHSSIRYDAPEEGETMASKLMAAFKEHFSRCLLVDAGAKREWTGAKLLDSSMRIATNLIRQLGLKPAEVVLSMCDHTDLEIIMVFGAILAGASFCGTQPSDGLEDLKIVCDLVRPNMIISNSKFAHIVASLRRECAHMKDAQVVYVDNPAKANRYMHEDGNNNCVDQNGNHVDETVTPEFQQAAFMDDLINGPVDVQLVEDVIANKINAKVDILSFMLTSGSTGRAKVVASTHEELIHGLASMLSASRYPLGSANGTAKANGTPLLPIGRDSIFAGDLPLDHGAGLNTMFLSMCIGSKFVAMPSYETDAFWQGVHDYRITSSIASTTFTYNLLSYLKQLIASGEAKRRWDLSCLTYIACAGSKMAFIDLVREIQETYSQLNVVQAYGCTEIGFISMPHIEDSRKHIESVGQLFPGLLAKIINEDSGCLVSEKNKRGELCLWANSKFKSYRCHQDEDAGKIIASCHDSENFYKTGDLVHMDESGRLYIHGRIKDTLFLDEDWKITPAELEQVVDSHPLVRDSAVVGVPDTELPGCDAPKAFVRLIEENSEDFNRLDDSNELKRKLVEGDTEFIANDIYRFAAERTAKPKHLKGGVRILKDFPRVGLLNKVDRKVLRQLD